MLQFAMWLIKSLQCLVETTTQHCATIWSIYV